MQAKMISAAFLLAVSCGAYADPAPWYQWRSKFDGKSVCAQTMPTQGWEKARGPYKDSHCEKLMLAK